PAPTLHADAGMPSQVQEAATAAGDLAPTSEASAAHALVSPVPALSFDAAAGHAAPAEASAGSTALPTTTTSSAELGTDLSLNLSPSLSLNLSLNLGTSIHQLTDTLIGIVDS